MKLNFKLFIVGIILILILPIIKVEKTSDDLTITKIEYKNVASYLIDKFNETKKRNIVNGVE